MHFFLLNSTNFCLTFVENHFKTILQASANEFRKNVLTIAKTLFTDRFYNFCCYCFSNLFYVQVSDKTNIRGIRRLPGGDVALPAVDDTIGEEFPHSIEREYNHFSNSVSILYLGARGQGEGRKGLVYCVSRACAVYVMSVDRLEACGLRLGTNNSKWRRLEITIVTVEVGRWVPGRKRIAVRRGGLEY